MGEKGNITSDELAAAAQATAAGAVVAGALKRGAGAGAPAAGVDWSNLAGSSSTL